MRRDVERVVNRARRPDHWILLDRSWAQWLGVKRSAGVYRIRGRELFRRLAAEHERVNTSGQLISLEMAGESCEPVWSSPEMPRRSA